MSHSSFASASSLPRRLLLAAAAWIWHWLRRPWLAVFAGIIGVILTLSVWLLPQLPGQLIDEPAAAATWLLNASTNYGVWGNAFLALGLLDVLRSPLLYLLLALLLPTLAAQLADQLGVLDQLRSVQASTLQTKKYVAQGTAIPIPSVRPLFRWRGIIKAPHEAVQDLIAGTIADQYRISKQSVMDGTGPAVEPTTSAEQNETNELYAVVECRLFGTRAPTLLYVRPLLMIGLLTAVLGAWVALAFGWQVSAPPLAPGDTFRSANRNLLLNYTVVPTRTMPAALEVSLQGEAVLLPTDQAVRRQIRQATLLARPSYPGVWVTIADGGARLTLPGESKLRSRIGLAFAEPGSEESILIPDQSSGLRIVQQAESRSLVIELYRSDAIEPVYRAELTEGGRLTLPFGPGDTELVIVTLPGLQVDVRHLPGLWLVWCGLFLASVGAIAFVRPSGFVLAQIAPWQPEYTVVVLQSDHATTLAELREALEKLTPPPTIESGERPVTEPLSLPTPPSVA